MYCSQCGAKNFDDSKFCVSCGHLLHADEAATEDVPANADMVEERENADVGEEPAAEAPQPNAQEPEGDGDQDQAGAPDASANAQPTVELPKDDGLAAHPTLELPKEQMQPAPGRLGPYELRGELGRGAMARVWRAFDPNLEREVAIKEPLFDPSLPQGVLDEMGRRFVKEGRAAAKLNHPNIVTIYAADVYDGRPAIVMELVEGATLGELLEAGPLSPAEALSVLDQLLDAVGYAHGRGVVHRDIKPDNVFVSTGGRVKLADFGIARVDDSRATRATVVGTVLGTPGYMSPEQATGAAVDARSDLFSVGAVGYEMLSGANPFGAGDATTVIYRIVHEPAPGLPDSASAGLPADLRPAIMAALAKDPADRPQSAEALKAALHGGALPAPAASPAPSLASRAARASSAGLPRWLPYAAVGGVCALVLAFVFAMAVGGGGGGGIAGGAGAPAAGSASTATGAAYLSTTSDGYVAIFTSSRPDAPYQITNIAVGDLDGDTAAALGAKMPFNTVDEANKKVDELRAGIEQAKAAEAQKAAEEAAAKKAAEDAAKRDYIFADSSTRRLSEGEVNSRSSDDLSIAMNEIWARHGRRFKNNWLQSYFNSKSWYSGTISPDDFNSVYKSTAIEDYNAELINGVLLGRGYDVNKVHPN